ncbi:MAG: hypothetical protein ABSG91_05815 [Syntrophobacteraceae bacterium]|jgi:hypothetical protein
MKKYIYFTIVFVLFFPYITFAQQSREKEIIQWFDNKSDEQAAQWR